MTAKEHLNRLLKDYPALNCVRGDMERAFDELVACYSRGGKLLLCGNGGSAADAEHIAGELMKGFLLPRPLRHDEASALHAQGDMGKTLSAKLQRALPALCLHGLPALSTAFANDVDADLAFAQQAHALAHKGDVLLAISTSGNARNVGYACAAAKARGAVVIGLTGQMGGQLAALSAVCIRVPERETYRVQELHLPVYHALCAMLEAEFFGAEG